MGFGGSADCNIQLKMQGETDTGFAWPMIVARCILSVNEYF